MPSFPNVLDFDTSTGFWRFSLCCFRISYRPLKSCRSVKLIASHILRQANSVAHERYRLTFQQHFSLLHDFGRPRAKILCESENRQNSAEVRTYQHNRRRATPFSIHSNMATYVFLNDKNENRKTP
jgi:hypothetical protein